MATIPQLATHNKYHDSIEWSFEPTGQLIINNISDEVGRLTYFGHSYSAIRLNALFDRISSTPNGRSSWIFYLDPISENVWEVKGLFGRNDLTFPYRIEGLNTKKVNQGFVRIVGFFLWPRIYLPSFIHNSDDSGPNTSVCKKIRYRINLYK